MKIKKVERLQNKEINQDSLIVHLEDGTSQAFVEYKEAMKEENGEPFFKKKVRENLRKEQEETVEPKEKKKTITELNEFQGQSI